MERFLMSSKLNNYPPLLGYLFDLGRKTCDAWIAQNEKALGKHSTLDVQHCCRRRCLGHPSFLLSVKNERRS